MQPSPIDKAIVRHLTHVFGAKPQLRQHSDAAGADDAAPFTVSIALVKGFPTPELVTLSTVGASNLPLHDADGDEVGPTRVEFIASCLPGDEEDVGAALVAAARHAGPGKGVALPGSFIRDLFGAQRADSPVPHGFVTDPFAYDDIDDEDEFEGRNVAWLQIVPVSAAEIDYAQAHSIDALQERFTEMDVEWESLDRDPVV